MVPECPREEVGIGSTVDLVVAILAQAADPNA